ncbi:MAG: hypothetical protein CVU44_10230 [Chloroflexi bacterium HGW-Chloroflexi-6]|nr:MAG: hypothetical protein CVU44_10230 [Chloroflexi bacterium HGW-Chloroflexi-6]
MGSRKRFSVLKRLSFLSWAIITSLLVCGAYFVYSSLRIKQAQIDIRDYSTAPFCDQGGICRKVIPARVLQRQTVDISPIRSSTNKYGGITTYKRIYEKYAYLVVLQSKELDKYEVGIVPNLEIDPKLFGVSDIYFPVHRRNDVLDNFAEISFPRGAILNIEIWNGKVTLIYSQYVNAPYSINTWIFSDSFPPITGKNTDLSESVITYAIPTTDNPLVAYEIIQDNFDQSLALIALLPTFFIILKVMPTKR